MFASVPELIDEAKAGRLFILADDEDRENEGDLILPAQFVTPQAINFMITHARGLVCLALTSERGAQLGLDMMPSRHESRFGTAFTVSIEAREGVTTGISAFDRAHTINVAADPSYGANDIVTPGHIFPLIARDGGVLERQGHTEASVEIARLAGLTPAAVICEVLKDDGHMARMPDLQLFAVRHGIKIGTVADLVSFQMESKSLAGKGKSLYARAHAG